MTQLGKPREFIFTCPSCGDPGAVTQELEVDIHSGATYRCALCGDRVVFEAFTTDEYVDYCQTLAPTPEPERKLT